jgi:hypothetical protein
MLFFICPAVSVTFNFSVFLVYWCNLVTHTNFVTHFTTLSLSWGCIALNGKKKVENVLSDSENKSGIQNSLTPYIALSNCKPTIVRRWVIHSLLWRRVRDIDNDWQVEMTSIMERWLSCLGMYLVYTDRQIGPAHYID